MKNRGMFLVTVIAVFIQSVMIFHLFNSTALKWPAPFFFLLGVKPTTEFNIFILILWYLLFVCLSFYLLGNVSDYLSGFGKYMLIRNYNKIQFLLYQYLFVAVKLMGFLVFQLFVYYLIVVFLQGELKVSVDISLLIRALLIYYLTLLALFLLQMVLELYVSAQTALLVTNMYVVFSVLLAGVLFHYEKMQLLLYGLIPNFMMVFRTDIMDQDHFTIHYGTAFGVLVIFIVGIIGLSIQRIRTKDLY